ncbi:hypothetical protein EVAR_98558_1 [Eumeta japonica]|uniref:Uncharacterized protein n=1 Tax=Eumeta variegata TaxID=151549 RepID=A0A4C1YHZ2_EUMVA|nr:hypothetical protein EVAR_98558_1 [Eumeta japonica]
MLLQVYALPRPYFKCKDPLALTQCASRTHSDHCQLCGDDIRDQELCASQCMLNLRCIQSEQSSLATYITSGRGESAQVSSARRKMSGGGFFLCRAPFINRLDCRGEVQGWTRALALREFPIVGKGAAGARKSAAAFVVESGADREGADSDPRQL